MLEATRPFKIIQKMPEPHIGKAQNKKITVSALW
jgi:hypothetical protein